MAITVAMDAEFAATISRRAILSYLQQTGAAKRFPPRSPPTTVDHTVREVIRSWNLDIPENVYERYIVCGVDIGFAAYQHTPYDLQIAIALFTFCATIFDDRTWLDPKAMREFIPRFCLGQPQLHPLLDRFVESTMNLRKFFPLYTANTICSAVLEYANEEVYCAEDVDQTMLRPGAWQYVEYTRLKSGIPEPYAIGIWPSSVCSDLKEYVQAIPEALLFINHVNDLFSFYKETLEGDRGNYINQYALVHERSTSEAVSDLVDKLVSVAENVRNILGDGSAREAWEDFVSGYTHFHLYCPRYKLAGILPEYF
ncbi:unnamed protein product [Somion occarium]|uniref:Terpene synthase n=1 Tax=Somion occarium TaxID=3059160 RepID=A0ABP1E8D6_9APHY